MRLNRRLILPCLRGVVGLAIIPRAGSCRVLRLTLSTLSSPGSEVTAGCMDGWTGGGISVPSVRFPKSKLSKGSSNLCDGALIWAPIANYQCPFGIFDSGIPRYALANSFDATSLSESWGVLQICCVMLRDVA